MSQLSTIQVNGIPPGDILVEALGIPVLIVNTDLNNTLYLGRQNNVLSGDTRQSITLSPQSFVVFDGKEEVYGLCAPGQLINVQIIPGGVAYFQSGINSGTGLVVNQNGLFLYNGPPALGDLTGSWVPGSQGGIDPYGNSYPPGFSSTGPGYFSGTIQAGSISNTPIASSPISNSDFSSGTIETTIFTLDANGGQIFIYSATQVVTTFTTVGANNFTAPAAISPAQVTAEVYGGGGRGSPQGGTGAGSGGGGGGGGYAKSVIPVTGGNNYNAQVGNGSTTAAQGGTSSFTGDAGAVVSASGGFSSTTKNPGQNGTGTGTTAFPGGDGGGGSDFAHNGGGGGGASGGPKGAGQNGQGHSAGSGGAGGSGTPSGGGSGGAGGDSGNNGNNGAAPGGGGGGAGSPGASIPGNGARGQVTLTYLTGRKLVGVFSATTGTDPTGVTYPIGLMLDPVNAPITALDPIAGNAKEPWHAISALGLANSFTQISAQMNSAYRMLANGDVYIEVGLTRAAFTATTAITTNPLPAQYRPGSRIFFPGAVAGDASLDVNTTGVMNAILGTLASATSLRASGIYSPGN